MLVAELGSFYLEVHVQHGQRVERVVGMERVGVAHQLDGRLLDRITGAYQQRQA